MHAAGRIAGHSGRTAPDLYAFIAKVSQNVLVVFRVENSQPAERLMVEKGIRALSGDEVYSL